MWIRDLEQARIDKAKELGAFQVINIKTESFNDVDAAFENAIHDKKNTLKIMIYPNGS